MDARHARDSASGVAALFTERLAGAEGQDLFSINTQSSWWANDHTGAAAICSARLAGSKGEAISGGLAHLAARSPVLSATATVCSARLARTESEVFQHLPADPVRADNPSRASALLAYGLASTQGPTLPDRASLMASEPATEHVFPSADSVCNTGLACTEGPHTWYLITHLGRADYHRGSTPACSARTDSPAARSPPEHSSAHMDRKDRNTRGCSIQRRNLAGSEGQTVSRGTAQLARRPYSGARACPSANANTYYPASRWRLPASRAPQATSLLLGSGGSQAPKPSRGRRLSCRGAGLC